jgi:gamma-glutamyltranspeptidase/glutathione hydrolase
LRRILFVALIVGILSSCGAQSATLDSASSESDIGKETTSTEDLASEGTAESTTSSTPVAGSNTETGGALRGSQNTPSSPAVGSSGMVSSAHPLATQAGLDVLAEGGNAFDAAVAVAAALNVVEPMMSGIGGYGATVIYDAEKGETRFLETGSRMPETLDPSVFQPPTPNYTENRCGAKAVSTPGNVNAWETLSNDYGELEWRRLFDPAIELAEGGFILGGTTAGWIDAAFSYFPGHAKSIYGNNGVPLRAGERLVQKDLARSLGLIAEQGAGAVYGGELGRAIDATMREEGGFLTIDDLRNNRAQWRDTVSIDHRGYEVVTASPPSTSWNALLRLGVMSQFDPAALGHNSVAYLHTLTEVNKQASQAARSFFTADPETQLAQLDLLLSRGYWADIAANINPSQATPPASLGQPFGAPAPCPPRSYTGAYAPANPPDGQSHTTHFVVADKEGNVVSTTQTLGTVFGSKVMPQGTGIWLNDAISWLRFEPTGSNVFSVSPGRQSLYALCPILVMSDGRPWIAIGTPGGRTIPQTTAQMLMNLINFDMDVQQAIAAPRIGFSSPNRLMVEAGVSGPVRGGLSALGHNVEVEERGLGNAHGLAIAYDAEGNPVRFAGGADPRGEGAAIGY